MSLNLPELAQQVGAFLVPFLPYLLKMGEKAAEEAGKNLGEEAWEKAKALWGKLHPKVKAKPAAQEVVQEVADHPDDEDAQAALRFLLKKILSEDETLAAEVARLWEEAKAAGVTVIASGDRAVAIGGDVSESVIVTGDQNVVQRDAPPAPKRRKITMHPVESSMIEAVGYDEETQRLQVLFTSGRVYCYHQVPPEVYRGLMEADSKGQYMRAFIIDVYPYTRGPCR